MGRGGYCARVRLRKVQLRLPPHAAGKPQCRSVHSMPPPPPLQMLALLGGKERTLQEWRCLLAAGGFRLLAIHPLRAAHSLIEAVPA